MSHRKLVRALVQEIRDLRGQLFDEEEQCAALENRQRKEQGEMARERAYLEEQRRTEQYREWERQDAVKDLEKARRSGDTWGADRALRRLRDI